MQNNNNIAELVTPDWLQAQFFKHDVKIKDLAAVTSIDRSQISAWKHGRPMSAAVKAFFYYYFKSLSND